MQGVAQSTLHSFSRASRRQGLVATFEPSFRPWESTEQVCRQTTSRARPRWPTVLRLRLPWHITVPAESPTHAECCAGQVVHIELQFNPHGNARSNRGGSTLEVRALDSWSRGGSLLPMYGLTRLLETNTWHGVSSNRVTQTHASDTFT